MTRLWTACRRLYTRRVARAAARATRREAPHQIGLAVATAVERGCGALLFSPTEVNMRAFMLRTLSPMDSIGSTAIARVLDNLTGASRGTLSTPMSDWHR